MSPNQAIPADKIDPFSPTRRRPTLDHSLVAGGAQRQWLQACLPDGHRPQCPSSLYPYVRPDYRCLPPGGPVSRWYTSSTVSGASASELVFLKLLATSAVSYVPDSHRHSNDDLKPPGALEKRRFRFSTRKRDRSKVSRSPKRIVFIITEYQMVCVSISGRYSRTSFLQRAPASYPTLFRHAQGDNSRVPARRPQPNGNGYRRVLATPTGPRDRLAGRVTDLGATLSVAPLRPKENFLKHGPSSINHEASRDSRALSRGS
jgi:hypothetical protein